MSAAAGLALLTAAVGLALLGFILWTLHRLRRLRTDPALAPPPLQPMACPRCAQAMTSGRVINGRGIVWLPAGRKAGLLANALWNSLPNTLSAGFRLGSNPAQRCERCLLVLVDHSRADYS